MQATKSSRDPQQKHSQLLMEAVEVIQDYAIFLMDPHGMILTWNLGAERIKGYTEQEIVGKNFRIFYSPEDRARHHPEEELRMAAQDGSYQEEGWRIRKDGKKFWAAIVITRLTDAQGKILGFSKVTRDLTERKEAEESLRLSEERFRQIIQSVRDYAIFMLDNKGLVATWNEGARRLKGYEPEEIIGKHFSAFYPPEEIESGKPDWELEQAALTGRFEDEGWRLRKDGTRFWANVVITAIRNSRGDVTGFAKVTRDLTERKRAEDKLRRTNESLERRVIIRTQELTEAKEKLERALSLRDDFISVASHELKTPITSLRLQAQMLESKIDPKTGQVPAADKLARAVATILRQSERLALLIEDLLEVSLVQKGKLRFKFEQSDLSQLLQEIVSRWTDPLLSAGGTLSAQIEPGIQAEIDPFRVEQVVANLLSNALKYARGCAVQVNLKRTGPQVALIEVRDLGPGIPREDCERIFGRFERGVTAQEASGMGLGLYISRTIVLAHGGRIWVESDAGQGSHFFVELPLKRQ